MYRPSILEAKFAAHREQEEMAKRFSHMSNVQNSPAASLMFYMCFQSDSGNSNVRFSYSFKQTPMRMCKEISILASFLPLFTCHGGNHFQYIIWWHLQKFSFALVVFYQIQGYAMFESVPLCSDIYISSTSSQYVKVTMDSKLEEHQGKVVTLYTFAGLARFEFLTTELLKIQVVRDVIPYQTLESMVIIYQSTMRNVPENTNLYCLLSIRRFSTIVLYPYFLSSINTCGIGER